VEYPDRERVVENTPRIDIAEFAVLGGVRKAAAQVI